MIAAHSSPVMVEVEGSRALVPACSRPAEAGMVVRTGPEPELVPTEGGVPLMRSVGGGGSE